MTLVTTYSLISVFLIESSAETHFWLLPYKARRIRTDYDSGKRRDPTSGSSPTRGGEEVGGM